MTAHKIDVFIIRYVVGDPTIPSLPFQEFVKSNSTKWLIDRSLMADHRLESERIEALKLVRCFITTKEGMQHISDGVMRAVIAIAEQSDEKLRNACLETLGEMGKTIRMSTGTYPLWLYACILITLPSNCSYG